MTQNKLNQNLYVVYDKQAQESGPVFHAKNDNVASRQFLNLIKDMPAYTAIDYALYLVGTYNPELMLLSGCDPKEIKVEDKTESQIKEGLKI